MHKTTTRFCRLSSIRCFPGFLAIGIMTVLSSISIAQAQPAQDEIAQIQNTIAQLQQRLSKVAGETNQDPKTDADNRVINLGSQTVPPSVKRIPTPQLQLQFYDLSDVFGLAPQYPVRDVTELDSGIAFQGNRRSSGGGGFGGGGFGGGGGLGGGPGGVFSIPNSPIKPQSFGQSGSLTIDSIIDVIKQTIDSKHWTDSDASIARIGNGLLINASPSTHNKIQKLFELFRSQWGSLRTVSIQGYWIEMSATELQTLVDSDASKKIQADKGVGVIDAADWKTFFAKAEESKTVRYASAITAHNGQTSHAISGDQPRFLVGITPEFSEITERVSAKLAHHLEYAQIQTGLTFQTTPMSTRGGNFVLVDLHCRIVDLKTPRKKPDDAAAADPSEIEIKGTDPKALAELIENPSYSLQRLSTTVRCPNGQVVLAGGMTQPNSRGDNGDASKHLYLFVKASVFNVKPDKSDRIANVKK